VLLDDVDTPGGRRLLEGLVSARRLRANHSTLRPDPMTVVAASQAPLSGGDGGTAEAERASYDDYRKRSGPARGDRWWYPVGLRDLTVDEVLEMVKALALQRVADRRVAAAVHRFTDGHPGTTRLLLEAVSDRRAGAVDLPAVLRAPAPSVLGPARVTTGQVLLDSFVHDVPEAVVEDLVTCSAARHVDEAARLQTGSSLLTSPMAQRAEVLSVRWWQPRPARTGDPEPAQQTDDPGPARMRAVLRRLLLARLAARPTGGPATWGETHARLRRECREAGDEAGALHHALALGEVELVTRRLAELLPTTDIHVWLGLLASATDAPSRLDLHTDPAGQVTELTRWASVDEVPLEPLARLVAARWIIAQPMVSRDMDDLHLDLAASYDAIAPHSYNGRSVLHNLARRHREAAGGREY
jgi:hypothetical protein